jgi:hypothetical protein
LNRTVLFKDPNLEDNDLVLQLTSTGTTPTPIATLPIELPPLILHPITSHGETLPAGPVSNVESARAEARRLEMKMLCCLGKDLNRWLGQCLEFAATDPQLAELSEGLILDLLVKDPPASVAAKMLKWGVADFRNIFARALGLNAVFPNPPSRENIADDFARNFTAYADGLYRTRRHTFPAVTASASRFHYDVYASGEYARLLEQSWDLQAG